MSNEKGPSGKTPEEVLGKLHGPQARFHRTARSKKYVRGHRYERWSLDGQEEMNTYLVQDKDEFWYELLNPSGESDYDFWEFEQEDELT